MDEEETAFNLRLATDPYIWGDRVYFTENWIEGSKYRSSIFSYDGARMERVTFGNSERSPQLRGGQLLYIKYDDQGESLMSLEGLREPVTLLRSKSIVRYAFHGDSIAVICKDPWMEDDPFYTTSMKYRADSRGLLRQRQKLILLYSSGEVETIASGDFDVTDVASNGKRLVFVSTEGHDDTGMADIFQYDVDGKGIEKITSGEGEVDSVCVSPGGEIAYIGHREGLKPWAQEKVIFPEVGTEVEVERGAANHILSDLFASGSNHLLHSDGHYYAIAQSGPSSFLCRIGEGVKRMTPDGISVSSFSVRDGRMAYIYSSFEKPSVLVFNGSLDLNPSVRGSIPEHITVAGMDAWVMVSGRERPSILSVHGGPHASYGNSYFIEFNYLLKKGFNIIFGNPRGSAGYGERFAEACVGDWGGKPLEDLLSFLEHAREQYGLMENFSITGGSYGGYMVNNAIVKTDRFRCAVAERCVSNLLSMCGTSDIGFWFNAIESAVGDPWSPEGMKILLDMSPLTSAWKAKTPTMFIHGEEDYRCPIEQSEQMYSALVYHKVPAAIVRYPGDSHEHARHGEPKNMVDRLRRKLEWFLKYQG